MSTSDCSCENKILRLKGVMAITHLTARYETPPIYVNRKYCTDYGQTNY